MSDPSILSPSCQRTHTQCRSGFRPPCTSGWRNAPRGSKSKDIRLHKARSRPPLKRLKETVTGCRSRCGFDSPMNPRPKSPAIRKDRKNSVVWRNADPRTPSNAARRVEPGYRPPHTQSGFGSEASLVMQKAPVIGLPSRWITRPLEDRI